MYKRYRLMFSFLGTMLCLVLLFYSCSEEEDCSMTARPYMVCKFYQYGASKAIVRPDTLDFLTIRAIDTDSILLNRGENVHMWEQALRYTQSQTAFVLVYGQDPDADNVVKDTIWVKHENNSFFVSMDCGYQMRQNITAVSKYTQHRLDSVALTNKEANYNGKENLKIIF